MDTFGSYLMLYLVCLAVFAVPYRAWLDFRRDAAEKAKWQKLSRPVADMNHDASSDTRT